MNLSNLRAEGCRGERSGEKRVLNLQGQCQSRRLRKKMKKKKIGEQLEKMVSSSGKAGDWEGQSTPTPRGGSCIMALGVVVDWPSQPPPPCSAEHFQALWPHLSSSSGGLHCELPVQSACSPGIPWCSPVIILTT